MNAEIYREILGFYLIPFMAAEYEFHCILHQDGDPKHTSALCSNYLINNGINWVKKNIFFEFC